MKVVKTSYICSGVSTLHGNLSTSEVQQILKMYEDFDITINTVPDLVLDKEKFVLYIEQKEAPIEDIRIRNYDGIFFFAVTAQQDLLRLFAIPSITELRRELS